VKMFDACKTRMIGLPYCEKNYDDMLIRFHLILECHVQTDRETNGRTNRIAISISRVNVLTRDKNLRGFINVKAYCSMTHLKQQKSFGFF